MRVKNINIVNFRNFKAINVEPGRYFNILYGLNGQGKTNFLEAIYILGSSRSFRSTRVPDLIRHGETAGQIQGIIESVNSCNHIKLILEPSGRRVDLDGKAIQRVSDLHGKLNTVVFSPDDTGMVKLGPETRRKYLDRAVYTGDIGYLYCWHEYHRVLKQRNTLLKQTDKTGLEIWTEKLATAGAEVINRRQRFVILLNSLLQKHYATISGGIEIASICYKPEGVQGTEIETIFKELMTLFLKYEKNDEKFGTTTAGPHRDDLKFYLNSQPLKSLGSQGQQKTFVLALKMAEIDNLESIYNEPPILLLDDISSELDMDRKANLLSFLDKRDLQTFITTTEPSSALIGATTQCAVFHVEHGNLTYKGNESNE